MDSLMHADIFFFISSLGFILLFIILAIVLLYILKAVRLFTNLTEKISENIDEVGDAGRDLIDDMRGSTVFKFLFRPSRRK